MSDSAWPALEMISEGDLWRVELKRFAQFREMLGRDVVNAFTRCFVHRDRLMSMVSFAHASMTHHGRDSVAYSRDLHTMVWFTVGTLRELAMAIRDLRSALKKRDLLDADSAPWVKLRDLEK